MTDFKSDVLFFLGFFSLFGCLLFPAIKYHLKWLQERLNKQRLVCKPQEERRGCKEQLLLRNAFQLLSWEMSAARGACLFRVDIRAAVERGEGPLLCGWRSQQARYSISRYHVVSNQLVFTFSCKNSQIAMLLPNRVATLWSLHCLPSARR